MSTAVYEWNYARQMMRIRVLEAQGHTLEFVQSIYRGWALFGVVIFAAIAANLTVAATLWHKGRPFWPSFAAGLLLAATLLVFFEWTYPANLATNNWTVVIADWNALRTQWELSHAVNALLTFIALCCAALAQVGGNKP